MRRIAGQETRRAYNNLVTFTLPPFQYATVGIRNEKNYYIGLELISSLFLLQVMFGFKSQRTVVGLKDTDKKYQLN